MTRVGWQDISTARLATWAERRPQASEAERAQFANEQASHLPTPSAIVRISDQDMAAIKAAHIRRFDEDLPRTETLMAVAHIGYRMALRDALARESAP